MSYSYIETDCLCRLVGGGQMDSLTTVLVQLVIHIKMSIGTSHYTQQNIQNGLRTKCNTMKIKTLKLQKTIQKKVFMILINIRICCTR